MFEYYIHTQMRRLVAITLLVIYVSAAVQQLLPWITDVAAHTFYWHNHLETVHRGDVHSRHVGHEIAASTHKDHSQDHTFLFYKDTLSVHLLPLSALDFPATIPLLSASPNGLQFFYRSIAQAIFRPPPNNIRS